MSVIKNKLWLLPAIMLLVQACSEMAGPAALFKKRSPHDIYADNLKTIGLERTEMGRHWLVRSTIKPTEALSVQIPYKETGYFAPELTQSVVLSFNAKRGQKINISVTKRPAVNFNIYIDVFQQVNDGDLKRIAFADTAETDLKFDADVTGNLYLRLQPELLSGGQYTLSITAGPSLGFPVTASAQPHIGSFFGDGRDNGVRRHEGIDIFAPKHSASIAAADGLVTSVTNNQLGGKVVFMRPVDKNYTLYYAHLDSQLVSPGQQVKEGDTIGLVGNTGNARYTPSHLHFGVYTGSGAIDPVYFVDRAVKKPPEITSRLNLLNATALSANKTTIFLAPSENNSSTSVPTNTPMLVTAAMSTLYKVTLPNGDVGFVNNSALKSVKTLRKLVPKTNTLIYTAPDSLSALPIAEIKKGQTTDVLGAYKNYLLVNLDAVTGWIIAQ